MKKLRSILSVLLLSILMLGIISSVRADEADSLDEVMTPEDELEEKEIEDDVLEKNEESEEAADDEAASEGVISDEHEDEKPDEYEDDEEEREEANRTILARDGINFADWNSSHPTIPTLIQENNPNYTDFVNVSTPFELGAAIQSAPTTGEIRVINVTNNITLTNVAPTTANTTGTPNGRIVAGGRNIVIQSLEGVNIQIATGGTLAANNNARHFVIQGGATRLILNEGVTITRVATGIAANTQRGGIALEAGFFELNGGHISGIHRTDNQGAVHQSGGTFNMFAGLIGSNTNTHGTLGTHGSTARAGGAGLRVATGVFNFHGGVFYNNRTNNSGGAISINGNVSTMNMFGGLVYRNTNGGGTGLDGTGPGTTATGQGSGTMGVNGGGNFNMFGGEFRDNWTTGTGGDGGVIESAGSAATGAGLNNINLFGGIFRGNSGRQGGAIANHTNSALVLGDPTTVPTTNTDGYAAVQDYLATGVIFEDNVARGTGGAIAQRGTGSSMIMHAGTIRNNRATGLMNDGGFVSGSGGGIFLNSGTLIMHNGTIEGNTAENTSLTQADNAHHQGGGGVYVGVGTTFTMENGRIHNNETGVTAGRLSTPFSGGGGVLARGTFNFNNGEISGNSTGHNAATSGGGGIYFAAQDTQANLNATTAATGGAMGHSGVVGAVAMPSITINNGHIHQNEAIRGAGIHYAPRQAIPSPAAATATGTIGTHTFTIGGTARIEGIHFAPHRTADRAGGGAITIPQMTFNLTGSAVLSGETNIQPIVGTTGAGTAARANPFVFNMSESAIIEDGINFTPTLTHTGGTGGTRTAIATFHMTGGTIYGHRPSDGNPTVKTGNGGALNFQPVINVAGGAAAATNRTITANLWLDDGAIREGHVTGDGGGVYHRPSMTLPAAGTPGTINVNPRLRETVIAQNSAGNGGGLYMTITQPGGVTTFNNTFNLNETGFVRNINNNLAENNGGGIYMTQQMGGSTNPTGFTDSTISNATIDHNQAVTGEGGGVYIETPPELTNALGNFTLTNSSISNNTAQGNGASIFTTSVANITINNSSLDRNTTLTGEGGGLYFAPIGTTGTREVRLDGNSSINENTAPGNGGGAYLATGTFTMNDGSISHNNSIHTTANANLGGGGIHMATGNFIMNNGVITSNRSSISGGGIMMLGTGSFTMHDGIISENIALYNAPDGSNIAAGGGGALTGSDVVFNMNGGSFIENTVQNHSGVTTGGGAALVRGSLQLHAGNFIGNRSELSNDATLLGGGAIYHDGSILNITGSYGEINFVDNSSQAGQGGALRTTAGGTINFANGGSIINNSTLSDGGGIAFVGAMDLATPIELNFDDVRLENNNSRDGTGGAISIPEFSNTSVEININGGTLIGNQANIGGGIYIESSDTTILVDNLRATENIARTATTGNGGAFSIKALANATISNSHFEDNEASRWGGAIYLGSGELIITDTDFIDNDAINGGAIYVTNNANLQLTDSTLSQNYALSHGGAIFTEDYEYEVYVLSATSYANLTITDAEFADNTTGIGSFTSPELNGQNITATNISVGTLPENNPLNNYDINFEGDEREVFDFSFIKTDSDSDQVIEGAVFELRTYEDGTWITIATQISDDDGLIEFEGLIANVIYHLFEISVPAGYELPRGHWLIEINEEGEITITAEGDFVPAFRIEDGVYFLGNIRELELPILGGLGMNQTLIIIGLFLMLGAGCTLILVIRHRKIHH